MPLRIKILITCAIALSIAVAICLIIPLFIYRTTLFMASALLTGLLTELIIILTILEIFVPQVNISTRIFNHGSRKSSLIALSFDDGPDDEITPKIIEILKRNNTPATFFILGKNIEGNEKILQSLSSSGFEIANHGFSHKKMVFMSKVKITNEIKKTEKLITDITGKKPDLLRTPHGFLNPALKKISKRLGYKIVGWTKGVWDTDPDVKAEEIAKRTLNGLKGGDIILLHDKRENGSGRGENKQHKTVEALEQILDGIKSSGFKITTVGQMIKNSPHD